MYSGKEFSESPTGVETHDLPDTGHGFNSVGGSKYFDLRALLHYLHFIQVTNPFISKVCIPALSDQSGWFSGILRMKELEVHVIYSTHPTFLSRWKVTPIGRLHWKVTPSNPVTIIFYNLSNILTCHVIEISLA